MSSSKSRTTPSPCAVCKYFRRKCVEDCVFAPHFPQDQTHKIETLHKVYGATNVGKILSELPAAERGAAVNSLLYEAVARINDPVNGCLGYIANLEHKLNQVLTELNTAKQELATYMGPSVSQPGFTQQFLNQHQQPGDPAGAHQQKMLTNLNQQQSMDLPMFTRHVDGAGPSHQHNEQSSQTYQNQHIQNQQSMDLSRFNSRFAGAGPSNQHNQQSYETYQQQHIQNQQLLMGISRFNRGFDGAGPSGQASYSGFTHFTGPRVTSTSLPFGGSYGSNVCMNQQQPQAEVFSNLQNQQPDLQQHYLLPHQLLLQQQNQPLQPQQHPQQEQHQHLQSSLLLPHQLLLQDQNQTLQPQPHPQAEEHLDHQQQLIPNQILLQKQKQPWQPGSNRGDGNN